MPAPLVLVLEDTADRVLAMREATDACGYRLEVHATAPGFAERWADPSLCPALISLDYHLAQRAHGTGLDVATALARLPRDVLVLLHSSDSVGARAQAEVLEAAGWSVERAPFSAAAWAARLQALSA